MLSRIISCKTLMNGGGRGGFGGNEENSRRKREFWAGFWVREF